MAHVQLWWGVALAEVTGKQPTAAPELTGNNCAGGQGIREGLCKQAALGNLWHL